MAKNNSWGIGDFAKYAILGLPPRALGSIDVTYRCNLKCAHCYFLQQGHNSELTLSQWVHKFNSLKKEGFPFLICGWLGGEPLLRKEVIEAGKRYFKSNVIFTNGTIELPNWQDCVFSVSIHGTEKYFEEMTGANGLYAKVKRNVDRRDLDVIIAFCITRLNYGCIEEMVQEWAKANVTGIVFEFFTPVKGLPDELWLGWELRDRIVDELIALSRRYYDFFYATEKIYRLMKSDVCQKITADCPFRKIGFSYDPMGRDKNPCTLGEKADCSKCGCILPFYSKILTDRKLLLAEALPFFARKAFYGCVKGAQR